jgi:hypothetical protein
VVEQLAVALSLDVMARGAQQLEVVELARPACRHRHDVIDSAAARRHVGAAVLASVSSSSSDVGA